MVKTMVSTTAMIMVMTMVLIMVKTMVLIMVALAAALAAVAEAVVVKMNYMKTAIIIMGYMEHVPHQIITQIIKDLAWMTVLDHQLGRLTKSKWVQELCTRFDYI